MSGNVSKIRAKGSEATERRRHGKESEQDAEFNKTLKEVLNYVIPQLGKQERKQWENNRIRALGGTLDKGQKIPYNCMQRWMKAQKERRKEALEEEKHLGVSMSASKHRLAHHNEKLIRNKKELKKLKMHKRDQKSMMQLGMGARESKGMVVIPNRAIRALKRK